MTDEELRQLVRESIAKHLGREAPAPTLAPHQPSASFGVFANLRSADGDGACLIEPTVRCNHCGYCLSYGH